MLDPPSAVQPPGATETVPRRAPECFRRIDIGSPNDPPSGSHYLFVRLHGKIVQQYVLPKNSTAPLLVCTILSRTYPQAVPRGNLPVQPPAATPTLTLPLPDAEILHRIPPQISVQPLRNRLKSAILRCSDFRVRRLCRSSPPGFCPAHWTATLNTFELLRGSTLC